MSASEPGPRQHLADRTLADRILAAWDWVERTVVGLLGVFALGIAVVQVFGRYIDPAGAITWAEEVIVYVMVWAVMIIASQLVRGDGHVRPDVVLRLLPAGAQRWVEMFNCLVAIAFTFGMVWYGQQVVGTALLLDQRSSSDLQFPMWIYYMALPVGGGLMLVRYVIRLLRYIFRFDPATMTAGHGAAREMPADLTRRIVE
ncbi:MAG: TRAP transporter small permease [Stellaceae bacterium]